MKTKILLFVVNLDSFFISHRLAVAIAAQKAGFDVHLATSVSTQVEKIRQLGITLHPIHLDRKSIELFSNLRSFFQLLCLFKSLKPDIVHLVTIKPVLLGGIAARVLRLRAVVVAISGLGVVFTTYGFMATVRRRLIEFLYSFALNHRNLKVIFQNKDDQEKLTSLIGLTKEQVVLVKGSGVDLAEFRFMELPENQRVIVFAARLLKSKGVVEFKEAARRICAVREDVLFAVVGQPDPGSPDTISQTDLDEWVSAGVIEWWGHRDDMVSVFSSAYCVVFPSYYGEGLPKVLIEAAACGRPVITTDHPGCRDAILANQTGYLVPVGDVDSLVAAIYRLIDDRERCKAMGLSARNFAVENFDIRQIVKKHLDIYSEI